MQAVKVGVKERARQHKKRRERGGERGNAEEREKLELTDMGGSELAGVTVLIDEEEGDEDGELDVELDAETSR